MTSATTTSSARNDELHLAPRRVAAWLGLGLFGWLSTLGGYWLISELVGSSL